MRVGALETLGFRNLAAGEAGPRRRDHPAVGAERRRQDQRCWRPSAWRSPGARAGPATSGRRSRFGEPLAANRGGGDGPTGETPFVPAGRSDRSGERRHLVDGSPARRSTPSSGPPLAIFLPDRLALVKGPPGLRRAHLDRLCAALWPARAELGAATAGRSPSETRSWAGSGPGPRRSIRSPPGTGAGGGGGGADQKPAARRSSCWLAGFAEAAAELGLPGAADASLPAAQRGRRPGDAGRGASRAPRARIWRAATPPTVRIWTSSAITLAGRPLRRYGSQGEQRSAVLALLFAERRALLEARPKRRR